MGTAVLLTAPPNRCSTSGHGFSGRSNNQTNTTSWCCFSAKYGGRTNGSQWEKGTSGTHNGLPRYYDEFFGAQNYDDEEDFGFRTAAKQRIWWSDDSSSWDDYEDDDEEAEPDYAFGLFEGSSIGLSSIFKVFRAFGWMVPAIIISMLVGTGPNAFFMALAFPLAQSALSLVFDTLWGSSARGARPKSRTQRRAYAGAASNNKTRKGREQNNQSGKRVDDYRSWTGADNVSAEKGKGRTKSFGGWDELDEQGRTEEVLNPASGNEKRQSTSGKLSRRVRSRPTPLLVRLLIAFFPFLGFWTKLL